MQKQYLVADPRRVSGEGAGRGVRRELGPLAKGLPSSFLLEFFPRGITEAD